MSAALLGNTDACCAQWCKRLGVYRAAFTAPAGDGHGKHAIAPFVEFDDLGLCHHRHLPDDHGSIKAAATRRKGWASRLLGQVSPVDNQSTPRLASWGDAKDAAVRFSFPLFASVIIAFSCACVDWALPIVPSSAVTRTGPGDQFDPWG